jgi:hypothetical protein
METNPDKSISVTMSVAQWDIVQGWAHSADSASDAPGSVDSQILGVIDEAIEEGYGLPTYTCVNPDMLSDQDLMYVRLRVCDWQQLEQNLREDADAGDLGPATAGIDMQRGEVSDAEWQAAIDEDAKLPCHTNTYATARCANVIESELRRHGWPG